MLNNQMNVRRLPGALALVAAACLLVACGGGGDAKKAPTQAAARVNDREITVHQINAVLQQQGAGLKPEQVERASREVLEKLIDQELALAQAEEQKIDRKPNVVAAIEAARRDVITRAYAEQIAAAAPAPTPEDVQSYFSSKPALFTERRIYDLTDVTIEAPAERLPEIRQRAQATTSSAELNAWLQQQGLRNVARRVTVPAENLPLELVDQFLPLKPGQALLAPTPANARILVVEGYRPAPVTLDQVRPVVEQFIANDRKLKAVQAEQKRLRATAKVDYLGNFANAAPGAAGAEPASAPAAVVQPATPAAPQAASAPPGGLDADAVKKGLGLK